MADKLIVLVNRTMWVAVIGTIVGAATTPNWGLHASLLAAFVLLAPLASAPKRGTSDSVDPPDS